MFDLLPSDACVVLCCVSSVLCQPLLYSTYCSMAESTLSLLSAPPPSASTTTTTTTNPTPLTTGVHGVNGGQSASVSSAAASSASSPPDLVEDFFELSARVLSRLPSFAFQPDQLDLQAGLVSCACQCLMIAHREALSATCHFLSTLLSEASDATLARSKRGRPLVQLHSDALRHLLMDRQLAAHIAQSLGYDIAVHLPQQTVHILADPLLLLYYCMPQHFAALLSHALQPYTLPPQPQSAQTVAPISTAPLDAAAIERFTTQISQLADSVVNTPVSRVKAAGRSVRELLDGFAYSCRQRVHR